MLVVEELYKEAVVNTSRNMIIFNGELDRIRSGCILFLKAYSAHNEGYKYTMCCSLLSFSFNIYLEVIKENDDMKTNDLILLF